VNSPNVVYNESEIISSYVYNDTEVEVRRSAPNLSPTMVACIISSFDPR